MSGSETIKTQWEIVQEKLKNLAYSEEDTKRDYWSQEGRKIAGRFLREKKTVISQELSSYPAQAHEVICEAIERVLLSNIILASTKVQKEENRRALEGLLQLKGNPPLLMKLSAEIEQIADAYLREKEDYHKQLRQTAERTVNEKKKAIEAQTGMRVRIDIERQPEFIEQWRNIASQIESHYAQMLDRCKEEIRNLRK